MTIIRKASQLSVSHLLLAGKVFLVHTKDHVSSHPTQCHNCCADISKSCLHCCEL